MGCGGLGPVIGPEQRVEPSEYRHRACDDDPVAPRRPVPGLIEDVHGHAAIVALLVVVLRIEREGEMMDLVGEKAHGFPTRSRWRALGGGRLAIKGALVVDGFLRIGPSALPPGVAADGNP